MQMVTRVSDEMAELIRKKLAGSGETKYQYLLRLIEQDLSAQPRPKRGPQPPAKKRPEYRPMPADAEGGLAGWLFSLGIIDGDELKRLVRLEYTEPVPHEGEESI